MIIPFCLESTHTVVWNTEVGIRDLQKYFLRITLTPVRNTLIKGKDLKKWKSHPHVRGESILLFVH